MNDLRFLHIPKTAGSTFSVILLSQYGIRSHFLFLWQINRDRQRWERLPPAAQQGKRLFIGHSPLLTGIARVDHAPIITLLREPVNRVKSFCQYVYDGKSPYLREKFPPHTFSVDELLESGEVELDNLQTNVLAGMVGGGRRRYYSGEDKALLLDRAWKSLTEKIFCYGLLEQFDQSLLLFKKKLGWQKDPFYIRVNRKSRTRQLDFQESHLEKIRELNRFDIALYEKASAFFEKQLGTVLADDEPERFRLDNHRSRFVTACQWLPIRFALKLERLSSGTI